MKAKQKRREEAEQQAKSAAAAGGEGGDTGLRVSIYIYGLSNLYILSFIMPGFILLVDSRLKDKMDDRKTSSLFDIYIIIFILHVL